MNRISTKNNKYLVHSFVAALYTMLTVILSGCSGTGHTLPMISSSEISSIQAELDADKSPLKLFNRRDAKYKADIIRINNRLLKNAHPLCDYTGYTSCFFQTVYSPEDTINAYASENYKITVYKGLLDYLQTEDEIAAVIAHEMGHHLADHNNEQTQNVAVGAAISGILTAIVIGAANANNPYYSSYQSQTDQNTIENMAKLGAEIGQISYSKEDEREADLLGAYLLARAGYNLKKAERIFTVMSKLPDAQNKKSASLFDTHPASVERVASWREVTKEIKGKTIKLPEKAKK